MKALVLSGGGARGACEAGVIAGLHARGEKFDIVCGTSIGAINGALCAQNDFEKMASMWHTIASRNVITYVPRVRTALDLIERIEAATKGWIFSRVGNAINAYADYRKLRPLGALLNITGAIAPDPIETILAGTVDFAKLGETALIVSATNLTTSTLDVFSWFPTDEQQRAFAAKQSGVKPRRLTAANFADAVRASAAIPAAFAPVELAVDDTTYSYVDGGVANNTPIGQAADAGATEVTVIFMDPQAEPSIQRVDNLLQVGLTSLAVMQQKILELDMKMALRVNAAAKAGAAGIGSGGARRRIALREYRPAQQLEISVLQFDRQDLLSKAYEAGLRDGSADSGYKYE